jgi:hypothetical protein
LSTTTITLDKPRTLKLDVNSLCHLEELAGVTALAAYRQMAQGSITRMLEALAAACQHEDPSMTVDRARELVSTYLANGGAPRDITIRLHNAFALSAFFENISVMDLSPSANTATAAPTPRRRGRSTSDAKA